MGFCSTIAPTGGAYASPDRRRYRARSGDLRCTQAAVKTRLAPVVATDNPRLVPQGAQHPAGEVRAQASFHANGAPRQFLERVFETQSPDLSAECDLPVDAESDEVKHFLADGRCR